MAIDLKSILGNTKSSILSPAEIADLGQRRQAMQMQREKMEFDRNSDLLNTAYNFAQNATTQEGFDAVETAFNNINIENLAPTQQAQLELIQSQYRDNKNTFNKYNELTNQLNEIQKFERDQVLNRNDDTLPMLRSRITTFESVKNELASDAYKSFRTPELNQFLVDKQNHFAIIKDALISEDIMTEEEYDLMVKSGNDYNVYNKLRDNKVKSIDERFKALDGSIAEFNKLASKSDAELIDYLKEVSSESLTGELADIDLDGDMVNQQIKEIKKNYALQVFAAQAEKNKLEEIYKTWTGDYKTFGFVPDTGDEDDEDSTTLQDSDNDGIFDGTNLPVPEKQRTNLVEIKKQSKSIEDEANKIIDSNLSTGKGKDKARKALNQIKILKKRVKGIERPSVIQPKVDSLKKQIADKKQKLENERIGATEDQPFRQYTEKGKNISKEIRSLESKLKPLIKSLNKSKGAYKNYDERVKFLQESLSDYIVE